MRIKQFGIGTLLAVCVIYVLVFGAVKERTKRVSLLQSEKAPVVAIDAGHGGEDGGAVSPSGALESQINLSVAKKLEQILAMCGIEPYMIRAQDISLHTQGDTVRERKRSDLTARIAMIEEIKPKLLVSVHQNHFSESKYSGAQVFYAKTDGSRELAQGMQTILRNALDPSNRREISQAESVYLMQNIACTGVLVECGFLSNPTEERQLQSDAYQIKISCAIGCAVVQFIEKGESCFEV